MNSSSAIALIAGLSFLSLWFGMALWAFDRWHRRNVLEKQALRDDQQLLLQRIQAPEQAVIQHTVQTVKSDRPTYVAPDDDEAWWRRDGADTIGVNPLTVE